MSHTRKPFQWDNYASSTAVSDDGCVGMRANVDGSGLEVSYDGAAWTAFSGVASAKWNGITNPDGNQALTMVAHTTTWTWNATTGTNDLVTLTNTTDDTGSGVLFHIKTPGAANAKTPFRVTALTDRLFEVNASGNVTASAFSAISPSIIGILRGRGTAASPTAVQSGDLLGSFQFGGQYGSSVGQQTTSATLRAEAAANFTATNDAPTDLLLSTKHNTTAVRIGLRVTSQQRVGIGDEITHADVTHRLTVVGDVKLNLGSDATGDIFYRADTTGTFTRLPIGSTGQVLTVAAGLPSWAAASGGGSPGGSGSEIQYRSGASTFGAVTGSSVSGAAISLVGGITVTQDTATAGLDSRHFIASSSSGSISLAKGRGTAASPTAALANDLLGAFTFAGQYSSTIGQITVGGGVYAEAVTNFTATNAAETDITIRCKPAGSSAVHIGLRVTSDSRVGIGDEITHAQTTARLTVIGGALYTMTTGEDYIVTSDTNNTGIQGQAWGTSISPLFFLIRGRGTKASPAAVQSGDPIGQFSFNGQYSTTVGQSTTSATIRAEAAANFTATNDAAADLVFKTKLNTSGVRTGMRITADRFVGIGDEILRSDITARLHVLETDTAVVGAIIRTAASSTADCLRLMASSTVRVKFTTNASGEMNTVLGSAALSTSASDGFLFLPTCAGAATGTPSTYTGTAPVVIDTTNFRIYVNIPGTGWKMAQLA